MTASAESLLRESRAQRSSNPTDLLREAARAFVRDAVADRAAFAPVIAALATEPAPSASWLSIVLGSAVESGADPTVSARPLFDAFDRTIRAVHEGTLDKRALEAALDALPRFAQGVVAHLARVPALREALAPDGAMLDRLRAVEHENPSAGWVREAIERVSGPLVVLHPFSARGALLRIENVSNCFHLFTLIQCAIGPQLPGGEEPRKVVAQCARGQIEAQTDDRALWHFGDPRSRKPEIGASIWGEANVRTIPVMEGVRVLLLWPPLLGARMWDSGFFGPFLDAMPSNVVYERALTDEEYRGWSARLGLDGQGDN